MIHLQRVLFGGLTALGMLFSSCSSDISVPAEVFALQYVVEVTDAATVSQIVYTATDGTATTVDNPALPFTAEVSRTGGESASLTVTGAAAGATDSIVARIQDDPNLVTTPTTYASETCLNQTGCSIAISNTF